MTRATSPRRPKPAYSLILAAGLGTRMFSRRVKLLHPLCGRPMLLYVLDAVAALPIRGIFLIVGNQRREVRESLRGLRRRVGFILQQRQLGTGHAVLQARRELEGKRGDLLILNGDLPTLRAETLTAFLAFHRGSGAAASLLTTVADDPSGYGRIVRDATGDVARIVEDRDASPEEAGIREINTGMYLVDLAVLFPALRAVSRTNRQGEYYLTDIVAILRREGKRVAVFRHPDPEEVLGVNERAELAEATRVLWRRKAVDLMRRGVTLLDPASTYIDHDVEVGRDTVVYPGTLLEGRTRIGEDCRIGPGCHIVDSRIGPGVEVLGYCRIQGATLEGEVRVGPFAHLRPETVLRRGARIGNFVETKKSVLGPGSKANHLTYLGDSDIGREVNIGAGTITCNYDGLTKHRTTIEDQVFIGSDTQLVAPVRVGRGAYVGAGSTITREVPPFALAISRARQRIKPGWARPRVAARLAAAGGKRKARTRRNRNVRG